MYPGKEIIIKPIIQIRNRGQLPKSKSCVLSPQLPLQMSGDLKDSSNHKPLELFSLATLHSGSCWSVALTTQDLTSVQGPSGNRGKVLCGLWCLGI